MTSAKDPASPAATSATTDREVLAGSAYAGDQYLAARQSLYHYQRPVFDLPGIVEEAMAGRRGTVVDVGCGNGRYLRRLRTRGELRVVGVDISPEILTPLSSPVLCADAASLPLPEQSAEAVLAMHMLYHLPDVPTGVRELARIVRPGGLLFASTNASDDKYELDELWSGAVADVLGTTEGSHRVKLSRHFALDSGAELFRSLFHHVDVTELAGVIEVESPAPVLSHLGSYRSWAEQCGAPFDAVLDRAEQRLATVIRRDGRFTITTRQGVLCAVVGQG